MEGPLKIEVTLPKPLEAFVREKVTAGGYGSASEVIREGLRLLQQYDDERLRTLRQAIQKGLASGEGPLLEDVTVDEVMSSVDERLRRVQR